MSSHGPTLLSIVNFRTKIFSPFRPLIQMNREEFSLAATMVPHRLQRYYRPPTKLWGGKVFTGVCVCVSTGEGGKVSLVPGPFLVPSPMSFPGG